ncbi:hypothetical protein NQD34_017389 [Periophthalmus magnuspinnatus]|nr:hypothetical protein NQD34_017389 [Periophthalmus magnuspinnatus]
MAPESAVRPDENLMMMQELEDRLKEQIDKLEHIRLAALNIKENLSAANRSDLNEAVSHHLAWLSDLSERLDDLHMNTTVFVQMNPKPCVRAGKHDSKQRSRRSRFHQNNDPRSEHSRAPSETVKRV